MTNDKKDGPWTSFGTVVTGSNSAIAVLDAKLGVIIGRSGFTVSCYVDM